MYKTIRLIVLLPVLIVYLIAYCPFHLLVSLIESANYENFKLEVKHLVNHIKTRMIK